MKQPPMPFDIHTGVYPHSRASKDFEADAPRMILSLDEGNIYETINHFVPC